MIKITLGQVQDYAYGISLGGVQDYAYGLCFWILKL